MSIIDNILEKYDLKYEDLNVNEKETLTSWLSVLDNKQLTLNNIKTFIISLRDSVEQELAQTGHNSKQDLFLKAR